MTFLKSWLCFSYSRHIKQRPSWNMNPYLCFCRCAKWHKMWFQQGGLWPRVTFQWVSTQLKWLSTARYQQMLQPTHREQVCDDLYCKLMPWCSTTKRAEEINWVAQVSKWKDAPEENSCARYIIPKNFTSTKEGASYEELWQQLHDTTWSRKQDNCTNLLTALQLHNVPHT